MESVEAKIKAVSYLAVIKPGEWRQDDDFGTITIKLGSGELRFAFTTEKLDTTKPLKLILEADLAKS